MYTAELRKAFRHFTIKRKSTKDKTVMQELRDKAVKHIENKTEAKPSSIIKLK